MMRPPLPSWTMRSAPSRPHRKTPVRFTSMTACHCASDILEWIAPSWALTSRASRVMPALFTSTSKRLKSATIASKRLDDLRFLGDVDDVAARAHAARFAGGARLLERLGIAVERRDFGAAFRERERHRPPDATGRARDDHDLLSKLHVSLYCTANTGAEIFMGPGR